MSGAVLSFHRMSLGAPEMVNKINSVRVRLGAVNGASADKINKHSVQALQFIARGHLFLLIVDESSIEGVAREVRNQIN